MAMLWLEFSIVDWKLPYTVRTWVHTYFYNLGNVKEAISDPTLRPALSIVNFEILACWHVALKFSFSEKAKKNLKKSPSCFAKSADLLSERQNKREIFSNFVAFS